MTLKINRDITRFIDDDTFPFKVTVCIGEKRIICSGIALAEQSHALEMKMRKDNGILMFEDMIEVPGSNDILVDCINYLHGAPLDLRFDNFEVIMKFASWYGVSSLFTSSLDWFQKEISFSDSVQVTVKWVIKGLKVANCLSDPDSTLLKDLAFKLILIHRSDNFCTEMVHCVDTWITGFDIVKIIENSCGVHGGTFVSKWTSLSMDNRNFVLSNPTLFDFHLLFANEDAFSSFISLISDEKTLSREQVKTLLDIQKDYFKKSSLHPKEPSTTQLRKDKHTGNFLESTSTVAVNDDNANDTKCKASIASSYGEENRMTTLFQAETITHRNCYTDQDNEVSDFPFHRDKWYLEVRNLPPDTSEADLWNVFNSKEGLECIDIIVPDNDYAILTLKNKLSAKNLVKSYRHYTLNGRKLEILFCDIPERKRSGSSGFRNDLPHKVLYIGNIPNSYDERELKQLFSGYGRVADFAVPASQTGSRAKFRYAFLTYENVSSAIRLVDASLTKPYFHNGNKLIIKFKKRD